MPGEVPAGVVDGINTAFTTSVPYIGQSVYQDGLFQRPTTDYTYAGTSLNFVIAPVIGTGLFITGNTTSAQAGAGTNTVTGRDYTANELIASVQQRAFIPLAARDFGPAQILRLFNEEIDGYLVPFVAQRRMEFWVEFQDITVAGGTAAYPLPSVALGGKLRAIAYVVGTIPFLLDQIDLPVAVAASFIPLATQIPSKYYFLGNNLMLFPPPSGGGTVRIYYYRRPSMLVLPSQCVQATGFPAGAPGGFWRLGFGGALPSAYAVNATVDLVGNVPNFTLYSVNQPIHATGAGYVELPGTQPAGLAVGDWLTLSGTSPVITGAPSDLVNLIIQEVALKVSEAKGTNETVQRLAAGLAKAEASAGWTIQQRNDGAMRKVSAFPSDSPGIGYPWS